MSKIEQIQCKREAEAETTGYTGILRDYVNRQWLAYKNGLFVGASDCPVDAELMVNAARC